MQVTPTCLGSFSSRLRRSLLQNTCRASQGSMTSSIADKTRYDLNRSLGTHPCICPSIESFFLPSWRALFRVNKLGVMLTHNHTHLMRQITPANAAFNAKDSLGKKKVPQKFFEEKWSGSTTKKPFHCTIHRSLIHSVFSIKKNRCNQVRARFDSIEFAQSSRTTSIKRLIIAFSSLTLWPINADSQIKQWVFDFICAAKRERDWRWFSSCNTVLRSSSACFSIIKDGLWRVRRFVNGRWRGLCWLI